MKQWLDRIAHRKDLGAEFIELAVMGVLWQRAGEPIWLLAAIFFLGWCINVALMLLGAISIGYRRAAR